MGRPGILIPGFSICICGRRLHARSGSQFPLYHSPANLSIGNLNKNQHRNSPKIVQHYLLTFGAVYVIIMVSRGEGYRVYHRNQTQHFAGKSGGRSHWLTFEGSKKNVKNPLTNQTICDIIQIQSGGKSPLSALVRQCEEQDPRESCKTD